jgi:hypothetical protein
MYDVMARDSDAMTRGLHVMFRGDRGDSEVLWPDNIACSGLVCSHERYATWICRFTSCEPYISVPTSVVDVLTGFRRQLLLPRVRPLVGAFLVGTQVLKGHAH